jgi:Lecithin retinol acyltransferase
LQSVRRRFHLQHRDPGDAVAASVSDATQVRVLDIDRPLARVMLDPSADRGTHLHTRTVGMNEAIPVGAHLASPRRGYIHHGIYAGNGRVIHYAGFSGAYRRGPVEEVTLDRFTRNRGLQIRPHVAPRFAGLEAVARARARLGEDRYRLWSNNCEHFVEWCIAGTARSAQVEAWRARVRRSWGFFVAPLAWLVRPAGPGRAQRGRS